MEKANEPLKAAALAVDWKRESYRPDEEFKLLGDQERQRKEIVKGFVRSYWPAIKSAAVEHVSNGKPINGVVLERLLGLEGHREFDEFARMQTATEMANGEVEANDLLLRVLELDNSLPWSRNFGMIAPEDMREIAEATKREPEDSNNLRQSRPE
jgi:hypothetical protein